MPCSFDSFVRNLISSAFLFLNFVRDHTVDDEDDPSEDEGGCSVLQSLSFS